MRPAKPPSFVAIINAHKILVVPFVVGPMWCYVNSSTEAFIYPSIAIMVCCGC
jgi:hypothetical protein